MKLAVIKFWDILVSILLFLIGIFLIYDHFFKPNFIDIDYYYHEYSLGAIIGFLIIFSVIIRVIIFVNSRNERFVDFDSRDGSVGISDKAMKDFVDRVAYEFSSVKHAQTKVISTKGSLGFILKLKILEGNNILELSQQMQSRIRQSVMSSLGIENVENVSIKVSEIIKKDVSSEDSNDNISLNQ